MKAMLLLKLTVALLIATVVAAPVIAQSTDTEIEILQEAFGLDKKAAVAEFLDLGEDAKAFWLLYDAYEIERKKLGSLRIEVLKDYAGNYANMTDEKLLELFKRTTDVRNSLDKLQKKYFNVIRNDLGTNKAAQVWQL